MSAPIVLSAHQVRPLGQARSERRRAVISLDLGQTGVEVELTGHGIVLPGGHLLPWPTIDEIVADEAACWLIEDGAASKIHGFSPSLGRAYSLFPTERAPTLINGGFTMHRIKRSNPTEDTENKIRSIAPIRGSVLDTNTGLGYTAIAAARTAGRVVTIELDPTVLEIARLNPWSQELFTNPKIERIIGDSFEVIAELEDRSFSRIIHDPPSFSLAGELYSGEFYRQAHRVLQDRGRMFHYLGNLESGHGRKLLPGVIRRLKEAGFSRVVRAPEAFGVVAYRD